MKAVVLTNDAHPWAALLHERMDHCLDYRETPPADARVALDFTFLPTPEKEKLIRKLRDFSVISDLSCHWGDYLFKTNPHLIGALSGAFFSPRETYEYCLRGDGKALAECLDRLGKKGVQVSAPGIGFTWPRIICTIINEAWYAREEGLAAQESIDTALKYGMRHPLGPFEWTEKIGAPRVVALLDELLRVTGDPRYRACPLLRLEAV